MSRRQGKRATSRRRQQHDAERGREQRGLASGAERQSDSPERAVALLRRLRQEPEAPTLQASVASQVLVIQATHGNQYVQRMEKATSESQFPKNVAGKLSGAFSEQLFVLYATAREEVTYQGLGATFTRDWIYGTRGTRRIEREIRARLESKAAQGLWDHLRWFRRFIRGQGSKDGLHMRDADDARRTQLLNLLDPYVPVEGWRPRTMPGQRQGLNATLLSRLDNICGRMTARGYQPRIASGLRTIDEQIQKYARGRTLQQFTAGLDAAVTQGLITQQKRDQWVTFYQTNGMPGGGQITWTLRSRHLSGLAADVIDSRWGWNIPANHPYWRALKTEVEQEGCHIGPPADDYAHVEL